MGVLTLHAGPARAYFISTVFTAGCHETITTEALRSVRTQLSTAAPLPANSNERALIDDLEFSPADDMTDLGGASLLVGVRDNDLNGRNPSDLAQVALVQSDPLTQRKHCLHESHTAEPEGSQSALVDCRGFIFEQVNAALDGLDAAGRPDPTLRTSLPLYLAVRHHVDASLPAYYVHIGQAIHTVEDLFVHAYRTPDAGQVTAVVNWIDQANNQLHEATDGPPHATEFDRCDDPDELRRARRVLATQAATSILRITLDPQQSRAQKLAGVASLLDQWQGYSPGCTFANGWCAAPERSYGDINVLGCDVGAGDRGAGDHWGVVVALALIALVARRRRRGWHGKALVAAALITVFAGRAHADTAAAESPAGAATPVPPQTTTPVPEAGPTNSLQRAFGASVSVSGSANDAALAATLGARLRATSHWTFGLDAEWNPWIALEAASHLRAGVFNGYVTAIFRIPYDTVSLRVTANLGVSRTLVQLYGVPNGSTGLYAGLSPLGIEWKVSRLCYVVANPLSIALPVPQLTSVPFSYPQYRTSIGLEIYTN